MQYRKFYTHFVAYSKSEFANLVMFQSTVFTIQSTSTAKRNMPNYSWQSNDSFHGTRPHLKLSRRVAFSHTRPNACEFADYTCLKLKTSLNGGVPQETFKINLPTFENVNTV